MTPLTFLSSLYSPGRHDICPRVLSSCAWLPCSRTRRPRSRLRSPALFGCGPARELRLSLQAPARHGALSLSQWPAVACARRLARGGLRAQGGAGLRL